MNNLKEMLQERGDKHTATRVKFTFLGIITEDLKYVKENARYREFNPVGICDLTSNDDSKYLIEVEVKQEGPTSCTISTTKIIMHTRKTTIFNVLGAINSLETDYEPSEMKYEAKGKDWIRI